MESTSEEKKLEEVNNGKLPRACVAVAEVRGEVDKLAEKVSPFSTVTVLAALYHSIQLFLSLIGGCSGSSCLWWDQG